MVFFFSQKRKSISKLEIFNSIHMMYPQVLHNGSSESCESASTSSIGSNNSHNNASKAPGAQLQHKNNSLYQNSLSNGGKSSIVSNPSIANYPDFTQKQVCFCLLFNFLSTQIPISMSNN